ncbi:uncharacterized protein LOC115066972 [Nannospalax galili]|uniref:uncharacterized protein LOC115066972 n=1 Tax=Nannospalax galili TaxID=1026970 RepID=UPI00111C2AEF|nr:uncharacterized protein LOC115066972 [Nannospalax galili]
METRGLPHGLFFTTTLDFKKLQCQLNILVVDEQKFLKSLFPDSQKMFIERLDVWDYLHCDDRGVSSGSGDRPGCVIGGVFPASPAAATEPAPSASRHFPPTDLLHRTDRDPDGKRPSRAGALTSSAPSRHNSARWEERNAAGQGAGGRGRRPRLPRRGSSSCHPKNSPVRIPEKKTNTGTSDPTLYARTDREAPPGLGEDIEKSSWNRAASHWLVFIVPAGCYQEINQHSYSVVNLVYYTMDLPGKSTMCVQCLRKLEEGIGSLELELQMLVSYHVSAENPT